MNYDHLSIQSDMIIQELLMKMNNTLKRSFLVFEENNFLGIVSIGDVQRAIINKIEMNSHVINIMRPFEEQLFADPEETIEEIKRKMIRYRTEMLPIVDGDRILVGLYLWNDLFLDQERLKEQIKVPVVIMAGGYGSRMQPLTNVLPKPLIPIKHKPIIHDIMDKFNEYGCNEFHLSVNYKANMIEQYFSELIDLPYDIFYHKENKPTGTAGSLYLMKDYLKTTFFISNCDIIIDEDYNQIYNYHKEKKNELTLVAAMKHYPVPYGVVETKKGGELEYIKEKPNLLFQVNTGMYILEPHLLNDIPENSFFHITHLIENIQSRNGKVGVFPINEASWHDIGDWDEYIKTLNVYRAQ